MAQRTFYENELVTRSAPRWAWDAIDECCEEQNSLDSDDPRVQEAVVAMTEACEKGE